MVNVVEELDSVTVGVLTISGIDVSDGANDVSWDNAADGSLETQDALANRRAVSQSAGIARFVFGHARAIEGFNGVL